MKPSVIATTALLIGVFVVCGTFFPHTTTAQSIEITSSDVILTINPENPEPYTDVTFSLESYVTNLSNRPIKWFVNGRLVEQGTGKDSFTANTGPLGTRTTVEALVTTSTGNIITKTFVLSPLGVDLLWEATDSYVPPFYKGKKLPAPQGKITVTAFPITPQGRLADQKNSVYYWNNDFEAVPAASGYGRQSFTMQNSALNKSERIQVTASSSTGSYQATKEIIVPTMNPKIVLYKKNADQMILWGKGYTSTMPTDEDGSASIVAEPYFFSVERPFSLAFTWKNQNELFPESGIIKRAERILRMETRGSTTLNVSAEHQNVLLQAATAQVQLVY